MSFPVFVARLLDVATAVMPRLFILSDVATVEYLQTRSSHAQRLTVSAVTPKQEEKMRVHLSRPFKTSCVFLCPERICDRSSSVMSAGRSCSLKRLWRIWSRMAMAMHYGRGQSCDLTGG